MAGTLVRSEADVESARASAQRVVQIHRRLSEWLHVGVTLPQVDAFVGDALKDLQSVSCFRGYRMGGRKPAFPSHACLSVNECIVHGTAAYRLEPLAEGDVFSIDIGVKHRGWIGDAAWTYVFGEPSDEARRLCEAGKESLRRGIETIRAGAPILRWAEVVQEYVEGECGFHLTRGLGGHGYGRKLHGPPFVSNVVPAFAREWPDAHDAWEEGSLVALEPMIAVGSNQTREKAREWPVFTADGSLAVHFEHDVLVTADGAEILTAGLDDLVDVIDR